MLTRTETLERLLEIRKNLTLNRETPFPNEESGTAIGKVDNLILDLIGSFPSISGRINEIINLALDNNISIKTAAVAIHELISEKAQQKQNKPRIKKVSNHPKPKKKKYTNKIEKLEAQGWN
ncbi:MAG: hypothetical protein ABR596_02085 [Halarsenatibacteraceae bacterium]